jgi:hypothetical protein
LGRRNECMQPHALYFMCAFGLSHVAAMLKEHGNLSLVPGIAETLILAMLTTPDEAARHDCSAPPGSAPDKALTVDKKAQKEAQKNGTHRPDSSAHGHLKIDFVMCMDHSQVQALFKHCKDSAKAPYNSS